MTKKAGYARSSMILPKRPSEGTSQHIGGSLWTASALLVLMKWQRVKRKSFMSMRLHSQPPIETNNFSVEHFVLDDMFGKRGILVWTTQPGWEWHLLAQREPGGFGQSGEQRG